MFKNLAFPPLGLTSIYTFPENEREENIWYFKLKTTKLTKEQLISRIIEAGL